MNFFKLFPLWLLLVLLTQATSLAQQSVTTGHEERDAGISLYKQGNTASAIKALKNAVKKDKLDAEAWHYLGLAYNTKGDPKNARKAFEEVVKLRPNFIEARTGLAYSLLQLKKFTEAFVAAEWVLKNKPDEEVAHYVIGVIYL
ncbi:MAG TPA: tetratricopeptide repeat protein, partial [Pyrinomonadaceae bacterium]|nr:tetratricopeptide repeat protein [Pyrinomonadaceae bacterium]